MSSDRTGTYSVETARTNDDGGLKVRTKPIEDQCSPSQRRLLDQWARSRWVRPDRVVFNDGWFHLRLTKGSYRYGVYGAMTWDYVRREVRKYRRELAKERELEAQRMIGAFI